MPGKLLPVNFDHAYNTLFWTIERNPSLKSLTGHRLMIRDLFTDHYAKGIRLHVASEVSNTGYHHDHVVTYTSNRAKVSKKFIRRVQAAASFRKANGTLASVRVHHPRRGSTDDFTQITKYLTESKYKPKPLDDGSISFEDPYQLWRDVYRQIPLNDQPMPTMLDETDGQPYWNHMWRTYDQLRPRHPECARLLRDYLATGPDRTDIRTLADFMSKGREVNPKPFPHIDTQGTVL